jgi:dsRNA-specific ribonuclease
LASVSSRIQDVSMSSSSPVAPPFLPVLVTTPSSHQAEQEFAWVGDAVLALWARERVLRETGGINTEAFLHLTANEYLAGIARPTRVEAEIGAVYRRDGLLAAFSHIEARLLPVFRKQQANRRRQRR